MRGVEESRILPLKGDVNHFRHTQCKRTLRLRSPSNPPFMKARQPFESDRNRSPFHRGLRIQYRAEQIYDAMSRVIIGGYCP